MITLSTKYARRRLAVLAAVLAVALLGGSSSAAQPETPRLTLDRLYSLPRLIGTAPSGFAWSGDGRRLAFLWNDEGLNFHDIWVLEVGDREARPQQVSRMPRLELAPEADENGLVDQVVAAQTLERHERDPGVTSVIWHPDGERLLASFRGDLWLLVPQQEPRNLTASEAREGSAAYSPADGTLAFLGDGSLWLMDDGSAPRRRTETTAEDVRIASFRWSPDGSRIAVLEADRSSVPLRSIPDYLTAEPELHSLRRAYPGDEPVRQRLGILDPDGGPAQWIDLAQPAPDMVLSYDWSPDSEALAVDTSDLYAKDRRIFVVDLPAGSARLVARDLDPHNETFYFWRIAWSTDGRQLYFLSDREEDYHVWAIEPAAASWKDQSKGPRRLTSGPWAVAELHPVRDGLVVVGNRDFAEERHLFRVGDAGGRTARLSHRPGTHAPTISPDGKYAAVAFSSDDTPPELLLTELAWRDDLPADGKAHTSLREVEHRITESPIPQFHGYRWVTPEYVGFPSHIDGTRLHGRLTLPPDFDSSKTYPAILGSVYTDSVRNQWGGRTAHPTWGLDQFLAQEGYILLNVDMRGSWGKGREHRRGIRLDYGGMDIEDLESGVRFLGTLGYVDMDRIGIWGSSYGGLMTAMSLFRKPGLYAAGIAGAPATNVWHALTGQMAVMMRPEDQPAEYADSSPFLHAQGLADPLMIIHGMRDWVVLFKDSVVLVQRLIMLGKEDVELVALPNAGHGWDNEGLAQTRFAFEKMVDFFDRHLRAARD